jgi:hypothetical protein
MVKLDRERERLKIEQHTERNEARSSRRGEGGGEMVIIVKFHAS